MATAITLEQYLAQHGAAYNLLPHEPTMSSTRTAEACHVSADCLAKAVVLKDGGSYLLAVLPASHHLEMEALESRLDRQVSLASEDEIEQLFPDCERGAIPPLGAAYGLQTIVDDSITEMPDIYFEGGDHATLVHMRGRVFERLLADAPHGHFSRHY
ncbi:MAG: aminoacyl-tRNA deacylase [Kiloniellales bacterium]